MACVKDKDFTVPESQLFTGLSAEYYYDSAKSTILLMRFCRFRKIGLWRVCSKSSDVLAIFFGPSPTGSSNHPTRGLQLN